MKTVLLCSIFFSAIALPALAELTDADLDKIRLIVNESEARVIEKVDGKIKDSENRMKSYVDTKNRKRENAYRMVDRNSCRNDRGHRTPISNSDNLFRLAEHKRQRTRETD